MLIPRSETFGTHSSISPEKIGRAPGFYGLLPLTRTPPISKIACKTLVLSYLNLRVRSYRFETSRYVIKLKHFRRSKDFLKLFFFKLLWENEIRFSKSDLVARNFADPCLDPLPVYGSVKILHKTQFRLKLGVKGEIFSHSRLSTGTMLSVLKTVFNGLMWLESHLVTWLLT